MKQSTHKPQEKKEKKKEKENRALTTFWLHIERIYEHSARLHIEHIE